MLVLAVLLPALLGPGCVVRKYFLRSDPPGAELFVDGESVGPTPFERDFVTYGSHQVELRMPGHERVVGVIDVQRPWWQVFPISFFTDVLWPGELQDTHEFAFVLPPLGDGGDWDDAKAAYERLRAARERVAEEELRGGSSDRAPDAEAAGGH
ncbi:MAG: hypothetical protein DHS20C15_18600 [Planctomycetota bacterium]|nr:MAG: hypothetical protein DHS20C15_18600 [Planctomycetota bacterium]